MALARSIHGVAGDRFGCPFPGLRVNRLPSRESRPRESPPTARVGSISHTLMHDSGRVSRGLIPAIPIFLGVTDSLDPDVAVGGQPKGD
jgi:hypothetical protein